MTDKLFENRQLAVKTAEDVRHEVVTSMQKAFKQMRRARIMTGEYTFPHGVSSRLERAREGMDVVLFFQGLSRCAKTLCICAQLVIHVYSRKLDHFVVFLFIMKGNKTRRGAGMLRFDLFWLCCDEEWVTNRMVAL